ncbi:MAG: hypothetical protein NTV88_01230 [Candidatus Micrarchaeota archaeon]|nr:hypothetical protein [Candidatus Micrarchaeota archaeon]
MAKYCVVCFKEKDGYKVYDDFVIRTIRGIKKRLGIAKNNSLVVCKDCLEEHRKKRKAYEKTLIIHIVLAGVVLVAFVLLPILTSGFSITAIALGIFLAALIVGMAVFSHHPKLSDEAQEKTLDAPKKEEKGKTEKAKGGKKKK